MKFLTVTAALFAGSALAIPSNNGGACIPKGHSSNPVTSTITSTATFTATATVTGTNTGPAPTSTGYPVPGEYHCPAGLYSNLQCCATDVLGLLDLDCSTPRRIPATGDDAIAICAAIGQQAKCCVVPVAGQDVLCEGVIPGGGIPPSNPPAGDDHGPVCPIGLYSNPQCCATDVLGAADLDCSTPDTASGPRAFRASCAAKGQQAKCCVIPVAGQSVLCTDLIGGH